MTALAVPPVSVPTDVYVASMDGADLDLLRTLLDQWAHKVRRNQLRMTYYNGRNRLRDLGIAIPPQLKSIETVVGWPAKSVDSLAHRIVFDGYVLPGDQEDPFGLSAVFADNQMQMELPQAITSALIHAVSFVSVTQGDTEAGQPEILVQARSGMYGTGIWDRSARALSSALSIASVDDNGVPTEMVMHLPDRVGHIVRSAGGRWSAIWRRNPVGRVLVEPLVFRPDLDRPFGRSRITRPVMSITDEAVRTVLRTEVSAEFFTAPQRALLGADEDAFVDKDGNPVPEWLAVIGKLWQIGRDEEGEIPQIHEFRQMSFQPHTEHLRAIASRFSGETSLPLSSLGIVQDNPSSAEAIYAAKEDLVIEASNAGTAFGSRLVRVGQNVVMLREGLTEPPEELRWLQSNWQNPATPSVVSAADAVVKQVAAAPWLAESPLILKKMGYTQPEIVQLLADKRRKEHAEVMNTLVANREVSGPVDYQGAVEDVESKKLKLEAWSQGVLRGADPNWLASWLGMPVPRMTGAVPVGLRMPEERQSAGSEGSEAGGQ